MGTTGKQSRLLTAGQAASPTALRIINAILDNPKSLTEVARVAKCSRNHVYWVLRKRSNQEIIRRKQRERRDITQGEAKRLQLVRRRMVRMLDAAVHEDRELSFEQLAGGLKLIDESLDRALARGELAEDPRDSAKDLKTKLLAAFRLGRMHGRGFAGYTSKKNQAPLDVVLT